MAKVKKPKQSQRKIIEGILRNNKTITSYEAFLNYGITRLSAIILVLRKEGWNIESPMEKNPATGTEYARYKLLGFLPGSAAAIK